MKTSKIKNTIKAIARIVTRKTKLAILENVQIEAGFIFASNLDIFVKLALPDNSLNTGYCLNFAELKKASEMFENINYLENEAGKITFNADEAKIKYSYTETDNLFKPIETAYKLAFEIGPDMAKLETACKFVSEDKLRPQMCYVAINNNHIVSTNAHFLYFDEIYFKQHGPDMADILISPQVIKIIKDINTVGWTVYESEGYLKFTDGINTIWQRPETNNFPNWQSILPQNHETAITANKKELINEVKKAANFNSIKTIAINANGTLKVEAKDEDINTEYSKELKEYSKEGPDIKIGFNADYLNAILPELETEIVHIKLTGYSRAAIINNKFLLMPIIINY